MRGGSWVEVIVVGIVFRRFRRGSGASQANVEMRSKMLCVRIFFIDVFD
jgi:hypothetical protein